MLIKEALQNFYQENHLPLDGGVNNKNFHLDIGITTLTLPNSEFRKKVIHIHDIQHVLYNCDITWKGEAFISGWEIATGIRKHLPIGFFSYWATGYSLFVYPKQVLKGYKAGLHTKGIIDLNLEKEVILSYEIEELKKIITKKTPKKFYWIKFIWSCILSEIAFLFPVLVIVLVILLIKN